jgi:cytochrome c553
MKLAIVLLAALTYATVLFGGSITSIGSPASFLDSKVQPKEMKLGKTSKDETWGEVAFNHETHSLKNYSADLKSAPSCVECHHTDQPSPPAPYKLSERKVVLTTAALEAADAAPVKSCASCHFQEGTKPSPSVTRAGEDEPVELTNEEAYHINCIVCHESVKKIKPNTTAPTTCASCHVKKA